MLKVTHLVHGLQTVYANLFPLYQTVDMQRELMRPERAASVPKEAHQRFEMVIRALIYKVNFDSPSVAM